MSLPVAVPDKIFGLTLVLDFIDRCHSLRSFHPPQAALPSLPNSTTSAYKQLRIFSSAVIYFIKHFAGNQENPKPFAEVANT